MTLTARASRPTDWLLIETLNRSSRRALPKLWWWEDYLSEDLFVVVERAGTVVGAIFAWPDESPVAWVRMACVADRLSARRWLDTALPLVLQGLRRRGVCSLAWMDYWEWAGAHLRHCGFRPLTDVETMVKRDRRLPSRGRSPATLRPGRAADIGSVVAVDRSAFSPHWRYSGPTLKRRLRASSLFVVAESNGALIGYAEGDVRERAAHLNRVAVLPSHQGQGIGAQLAGHLLRGFWRQGAEHVTLNTQAHNLRARRLYRRLGFEQTGERATAWELLL